MSLDKSYVMCQLDGLDMRVQRLEAACGMPGGTGSSASSDGGHGDQASQASNVLPIFSE